MWSAPSPCFTSSRLRVPRLLTAERPCRADPPHKDVEYGGEQQAEQRHAQHAEEHGGAECLTQFGARPCRQDERHHAKDESKGCHQDRTQSRPRRLYGGIPPGCALLLGLLCKLDDQNGILR